jgi:hypothetical protein
MGFHRSTPPRLSTGPNAIALFREPPKRNGRCACCTNPRHNGYFKGTDRLTIQERRYAQHAVAAGTIDESWGPSIADTAEKGGAMTPAATMEQPPPCPIKVPFPLSRVEPTTGTGTRKRAFVTQLRHSPFQTSGRAKAAIGGNTNSQQTRLLRRLSVESSD